MKKILSLFLIFIMLFLCVGCNGQEQPKETGKETEEKVYDNTPYSQIFRECYDYKYQDFDSLLKKVNNIVKATYIGTVKESPDYLHDFKVKEVIKGTFAEELITVLATPMGYNFSGHYDDSIPVSAYDTLPINYEEGKDYLLLLIRSQNVYMDNDCLKSVNDSLVIPIDDNGKINLKNCKMYNTDLMIHITDSKTEEALKNGTFVERLLELTKDNPSYSITVDTTYKDPETIAQEAEYVWIITVEKNLEDSLLPYYAAIYNCNIIKKVKGDYPSDTVIIQLPTEKVEVGKTYIVALNSKHYLSSRYSLFAYPIA